jgi:hypothetical protein
MKNKKNKSETNVEYIRELVNDCIFTNNIELIVELLHNLQVEYVEIAQVATLGEYKADWTHQQTINYITYET